MIKVRLNLRNVAKTVTCLAATRMKKVLLFISILFFLSGNLQGQELISRGKPVTASNTHRNHSTSSVTDGNSASIWNAGAQAPQWIQIDLQKNYDISSIKLNPEIAPTGKTVYKIYASEDLKVWIEVDNFTENNPTSGVIISRNYNLFNIRGVKIEIVSSSTSWIAWREIEVFGTIGGTNNYSNSNQNSVNVYETVKKIDCYSQIIPEIFVFSDVNIAFLKISENTFSIISTEDLQEKTNFNFKGNGIINLSNFYIDGNSILLAVLTNNKGKGEIKEYVKYNLSTLSSENVKCKDTPRGCIMSSASSNYISLRNNTPYDFGKFKIFFRSNGTQYFYEISKTVAEKEDFNSALSGNRNSKLDFLKKYPNSEYKNDITTSFVNSFSTLKDISDFTKNNNEFNTQLDERAFILVQNSNSENQLQEYLYIFPNGKYFNNVNNKIASIKQAKVDEGKRVVAEKEVERQREENQARLAEEEQARLAQLKEQDSELKRNCVGRKIYLYEISMSL